MKKKLETVPIVLMFLIGWVIGEELFDSLPITAVLCFIGGMLGFLILIFLEQKSLKLTILANVILTIGFLLVVFFVVEPERSERNEISESSKTSENERPHNSNKIVGIWQTDDSGDSSIRLRADLDSSYMSISPDFTEISYEYHFSSDSLSLILTKNGLIQFIWNVQELTKERLVINISNSKDSLVFIRK